MRIYKYRGDKPNFGDELNDWLWPKLLPMFFDSKDDKLFLGIGSTLFNNLPQNCTKIVCGAGYGGYTPAPNVRQGDWDIYFVRGPVTASALRLPSSLALGDPAILVRRVPLPETPKTVKFSYMPHLDSHRLGAWDEACSVAGIRLIDPSAPVERVLTEIQQSEVLISEALHGVIVADALRVPWVAILPLAKINRMKWFDWARSMGLEIGFQRTPCSNIQELFRQNFDRHPRVMAAMERATFGISRGWDAILLRRVVRRLRELTNVTPQMSELPRIDELSDEMMMRIQIHTYLIASVSSADRNVWCSPWSDLVTRLQLPA